MIIRVNLDEENGTFTSGTNTKSNDYTAPMPTYGPKGTIVSLERELRASVYNHIPSLYPPAIRYISENNRLLVWERPPTFKTISYTNAKMGQASYDQIDANLHRIPVPWQIYVAVLSADMRIAGLRMFFRNSKLSWQDTVLGYPYLPNFYEDASICKASLSTIQRYPRTLQGVMQAGNDMVWQSGYNADLFGSWSHWSTMGSHNKIIKAACNGGTADFHTFVSILQRLTLEIVVSWDYPSYGLLNDVLDPQASLNSGYVITDLTQNILLNVGMAIEDAATN